jgi:hypothetical protein
MESIKAAWINGQILPLEPVAWPEGMELVVEPALADSSWGLLESQWRSDPQAIAEWDAWLATLQPRILTNQERTELAAYESEHRQFNLDAVRQQMAMGDGE